MTHTRKFLPEDFCSFWFENAAYETHSYSDRLFQKILLTVVNLICLCE